MEKEMIECIYCGKKYTKMGMGTHVWRKHGEGVKWNANNRNRKAWNKGLTKKDSPSLQQASESMKQGIKEGRISLPFLGKKHSEETRQKWAKNPNMGGLRQGSGRGIKGWYSGFYCRSTWELAWLVYQIDHGIQVKKCVDRFPYFIEGKQHLYYPDFVIDDTYYEIKGYRDNKVQEKINQFPKNKILVLVEGKKEIKPYLEYAINRYGGNFWNVLYQPEVAQEVVAPD